MTLLQKHKIAVAKFRQYGSVFVGEEYIFFDHKPREKPTHKFNVSVVLDEKHVSLLGVGCIGSGECNKFDEALEAVKKEIRQRTK